MPSSMPGICVKAKGEIGSNADGDGLYVVFNKDGGWGSGKKSGDRSDEKEGEAMKTSKVNQELIKTSGQEGEAIRVGGKLRIKECEALPEVVGEEGVIVDMQIQELDKYATCPVWAKILTGEQKGKVYGFRYDEVEMMPRTCRLNTIMKTPKTTLVEQLEEIVEGFAAPMRKGGGGAIRIGRTLTIKTCEALPEVVGERGEIVDMQVQELDKYATYPVWVKVLAGKHKGRIYGFRYDELKVLPEVCPEKITSIKVVEELEECLKGMRIGCKLTIKKCEALPEVVGEGGEIVDMQIQEFEKYATYPVWVKILTGERKGKVYGFRYDEVVVVPQAWPERMIKTEMAKRLEDLLRGITTVEEIVEIDKAIREVKGRILTKEPVGFWEGKVPCWEMLRCPEKIRDECPAFRHQGLPCWQIEGTYSKLHGGGQKGCNTDICRVCRVYKRWGQGEPIEIKLFDKGFNALKAGEKAI